MPRPRRQNRRRQGTAGPEPQGGQASGHFVVWICGKAAMDFRCKATYELRNPPALHRRGRYLSNGIAPKGDGKTTWQLVFLIPALEA